MTRTAPAPERTLRALLAERNTGRLLISRIISLIGDFITPIALAFAVLDSMHGSLTDVGLVIGPVTLGVAVATLAGGVLADRVRPLRVMAAADCVRCLTQIAASVLIVTGSARVWELALLSFLRGLAGGFFSPASRSCWPSVVQRQDLPRINSLLGMIGGVGVVLGPTVAAVLLNVVTPGYLIGLDGLSFLVSAGLVASLRVERDVPKPARSGLLTDFRDGWRTVWQRRWLVVMLGQVAVISLLTSGPLQALGPTIAHQRYTGALGYATFLGAAGVGALLAGIIALRVSTPQPAAVAAGSLLLATAAPVALAVGAAWWIVALCYLLLGAAESFYGTFWESLLQRQIPQDALARVYSFDTLIPLMALPVGAMLIGPMVAVLGTTGALLLAAAAVPIATIPVLFRRDVRTEEPAPANLLS